MNYIITASEKSLQNDPITSEQRSKIHNELLIDHPLQLRPYTI